MYHRPTKPTLEYYIEYDEFLRAWCVRDTEGTTWVSNVPKEIAEQMAARYNTKEKGLKV